MELQSTKNDSEILDLMIEYCESIQSDCEVIDNEIEDFLANEIIQRSCSFSLIQIGELSKRLSDETKDKDRTIKWRKIAGLRDVIVHRYERVDFEELWDTIVNDIPVLKKSLTKVKNELKR